MSPYTTRSAYQNDLGVARNQICALVVNAKAGATTTERASLARATHGCFSNDAIVNYKEARSDACGKIARSLRPREAR
jgi:hypothetical protein